MSLGRTSLRFLFLAAIGHQVTYTVVGGIFEGRRRRVSRINRAMLPGICIRS